MIWAKGFLESEVKTHPYSIARALRRYNPNASKEQFINYCVERGINAEVAESVHIAWAQRTYAPLKKV